MGLIFQSPQGDTPASQSLRDMISWRVNLPGVWYPGESVFLNLKFVLSREILTSIENIVTHRSVAQADLNNEKKLEVENLVGLSLK